MAHVVNAHYFDKESGREAVKKRWDKAWSKRSPSEIQENIREYFNATGRDPATADPNVALACIMNDAAVPSEVRVVAAKTLQPYFHGPPLTPGQVDRAEGYIEATNPEMAAKRTQAYELVLRLLENQSANQSGSTEVATNPAPTEAEDGEVLEPYPNPDGAILARDVTDEEP